jgi:type IV pilus assembly protein PilE
MKKILNEDGFTLTEILVAIVIIGILTVLAFSKFDGLITRTKSIEAENNLKMLYEFQKMYHMRYDKYSSDFRDIGFEQLKLVTEEGGTARYRIEIERATMQEFRATATSVVDFDGDGIFNVWEVTQEGIIKEIQVD